MLVSMSNTVRPSYSNLSNVDIEMAILSKSSEQNLILPPYLYRDENNTLRATGTNRRAFRGIGSVEVLDSHNEIVDIEAIRKIMPIMVDEMGGTLLLDHKNLRMGTILGWGNAIVYDEKLKKEHEAIFVDFEMFDSYQTHKDTIRDMDLPDGNPNKINMLSIGGRKLKKVRECDTNKCYNRVTDIEGHEFSITKKGSNAFSFILEKSERKPFGDVKMEVSKPQTQDQSKVSIKFPDEDPIVGANVTGDTSLTKMEPKKEKKEKGKEKKVDEKLEEMDEKDEEDEYEDKDKKMEKIFTDLTETLEKMNCRMTKMEDTLAKTEASTPKKVKKSITHEGNTYVLKKSSDKALNKLEEKIDSLKKGKPVIPEQTTSILEVETPKEITPLAKKQEELSKMTIEQRVSDALSGGNRTRDNLARAGIHIQN